MKANRSGLKIGTYLGIPDYQSWETISFRVLFTGSNIALPSIIDTYHW